MITVADIQRIYQPEKRGTKVEFENETDKDQKQTDERQVGFDPQKNRRIRLTKSRNENNQS